MKKSLIALFALALACVFGTATMVYADTAPAGGAAPSAEMKKDDSTAVKKTKKTKKMKKKAAKKEMSAPAAPAAPAPATK